MKEKRSLKNGKIVWKNEKTDQRSYTGFFKRSWWYLCSADSRRYIQNEIDQLVDKIDRVLETTKFNETYLLKGAGTEITTEATAVGVSTFDATNHNERGFFMEPLLC